MSFLQEQLFLKQLASPNQINKTLYKEKILQKVGKTFK